MTHILAESTAGQTVILGPFVDDTDGVTPETGLTILNSDIRLNKHGQTTFANKNSGGATHIEDGYYYTTLDATDSNSVGRLELQCTMSGALPVRMSFQVVDARIYNTRYGNDTMQADVTQWNGSAVATPTVAGVPEVDLTHMNGVTTPVTALNAEYRYGWIVHANGGTGATTTTVDFTGATNIPTSTATNDDVLNGRILFIYGGTGLGQARQISDYDGTTQVVTVSQPFDVTPTSTSDFLIVPWGPVELGAMAVSEPTSGPTWTGLTLEDVMAWLFAAFKNKAEQDRDAAGAYVLYADDGTTELGNANHTDDGTTFTKGPVT